MKILEIGPGEDPLIFDRKTGLPNEAAGTDYEYHAIQPATYGGILSPESDDYIFPEHLLDDTRVTFTVGDAAFLTDEDESYDLVYAANVFTDPRVAIRGRQILDQCVRVLKTDAHLVTLDTYTPEIDGVAKYINSRLRDRLVLELQLTHRVFGKLASGDCSAQEWINIAGSYSAGERRLVTGGVLRRYRKANSIT